jgi:hypothetical protein
VFHLALLHRLTFSSVHTVNQRIEVMQYHILTQRPTSSCYTIHWFCVDAISAASSISCLLRRVYPTMTCTICILCAGNVEVAHVLVSFNVGRIFVSYRGGLLISQIHSWSWFLWKGVVAQAKQRCATRRGPDALLMVDVHSYMISLKRWEQGASS